MRSWRRARTRRKSIWASAIRRASSRISGAASAPAICRASTATSCESVGQARGASNRCGGRSCTIYSQRQSVPWRWGFSVVTTQLEQVLLHDRESERGNQLIKPHAADLCLQEELSDRHLIKG